MRLWEGFRTFIDVLLPARCQLCGAHAPEGPALCRSCVEDIELMEAPFCPRCGWPFPSSQALEYSPEHTCTHCEGMEKSFEFARSLGPYRGKLREAVNALKFQEKADLGMFLADLMFKNYERLFSITFENQRHADAVAHVPLHTRRWRERGYDQARILAASLARRLGIPALEALTRVKPSKPQTELRGEARRRNVRGAFAPVPGAQLKGLNILLIDDVFTTGATLCEAARALRKAGAREVWVYTLARTL